MERKQISPIKVIFNLLILIFISFIFIFIIFALIAKQNNGIPKFFGKSYLTVLSDSMNIENEDYNFKGFKRGDIIVIDRYSWSEASETQFDLGKIITFEWVDDNGNLYYLTHRIIDINKENGYYLTQGDVASSMNLSIDPADGYAEKVYFVEVVGTYEKTIPWIGNIFLFLQSPLGFLLLVVIPLIGLFIFEIFNFRKAYIGYRKEIKGDNKKTEDLQKEIELLHRKLKEKDKQNK